MKKKEEARLLHAWRTDVLMGFVHDTKIEIIIHGKRFLLCVKSFSAIRLIVKDGIYPESKTHPSLDYLWVWKKIEEIVLLTRE